MIPCLNKDAQKLLVGTADERYDYSPEYFRKTHFPQIMHRYHGNQLIAEITENELFHDLLEVDTSGNRLYFVFGSTGAGKSELLCWIKDKWINHQTQRPVIRISRSELNPQILIKKCFDTLGIPLGIQIDENRWELLLRKPITLINQIVWTTLAETLSSDDEIVPVALLVRPIIEKNVTEFTLQVQRGRIKKPLEVLHHVQFKELMANTTVTIPLEYQSFRQTLSQKLDQFLFQGWDIRSLFKQLTEQLKKRNIRPLLLIDDLVQSVNIYATDLLDQLITLEEGNWDVVIGLTPGAIQDSEKGFDLTQRIQNLDTIADRVKKLWLSDESGKDFYNLDRSQVVPYMSNYLVQLKGSQGFSCSKECHHYQDCLSVVRASGETNEEALELDVNLLPFNRFMVKRIFDAIPVGKGKLRYMILNSKEIIRFFQKGKRDWVSRVIPLVKREKFAEHADLFVKTYAEWYAPEEADACNVPREVLKYYGYQSGDITVRLHSLEREIPEVRITVQKDYQQEPMIEKPTVRDWVEGKVINPELLEPVRLGVSTLVHDVTKGVNISRLFTPRSNSVIQRKDVVNRTRYPISFENNGTGRSIRVNRGYAALQISNFQSLKYSEKGNFFLQIANEYETSSWVYQAEDLRLNWKEVLDKELGMTVSVFAYQLKAWTEICTVVGNSHWASDLRSKSPFTQELLNLAEQCYQDWYMLRDNLFDPIDPLLLQQMDFGQWLTSFKPGKELEHYQIGEISLYVFFVRLKEEYQNYLHLLENHFNHLLKERLYMVPFLFGNKNEQYQDYAKKIQGYSKKNSFTFRDFIGFTRLDEQLTSGDMIKEYNQSATLYASVERMNQQFDLLCEEMRSNMLELGENLLEKSLPYSLQWTNLDEEKEKLSILVNQLTKLNHCLRITPKNVCMQILQVDQVSPDVIQVKTIWNRFIECAKSLIVRQSVEADLLHNIVSWQVIDFHELKDYVAKVTLREEEKLSLLKHLQNDLGCNHMDTITDILEVIESNKELRPAIKRQLRALLEHGYSTLPPMQWKKLLDELKEKFPALFEVVEIRLVASGK